MRFRFFILLAAVMVFFTACDSDEPSRSNPTDPEEAASVAEDGGSATASSPLQEELNLLARGLALALSDDELRVQLLEDLRDSPFLFHQVHLQSYLRGVDGRKISDAAASALDITVDEFHGLLPETTRYRFGVDVAHDRVRWNGEPNAVVLFLSEPNSVRSAEANGSSILQGFDLKGNTVSVPVNDKAPFVVITSYPSEKVDFGPTPEETRKEAPQHSRSTISTWDAEQWAASDPSDGGATPSSCADCDGPDSPPPYGPAVQVSSGCSQANYTSTTSSNDEDADGIRDSCEEEFTQKMGPYLNFAYYEDCLGKESYWVVKSVDNGDNGPRIGYLLSYYRDCGTLGHKGDSEFVITDLHISNDSIYLYKSILSAHWGSCCGYDQTSTEYGNEFAYSYSRPVVWVAEDKHANYVSKASCDNYDNCSPTGISGIAAFYSGANLGHWWNAFDLDPGISGHESCTRSRESTTFHPGTECFFPDWYFDGWIGSSDETTGYRYVMEAFDLLLN